jgi:hypothetical protein
VPHFCHLHKCVILIFFISEWIAFYTPATLMVQLIYPCLFFQICRELKSLCLQDEMVGSSEDEPCPGDTDATDLGQEHSSCLADRELKEMLLKKYSGCLSRLRSEFLKKRKKGKLPKDARWALMDWWNTHYRWPYPTVTS